MANAPQMKIPIGANTQDFDKGAKKVKQEMQDLDKVSSDVFADIGKALGVDTQKLQQYSNAVAGLGNKLQQAGTEGEKAFGNILRAIGPISGAIAGIGIAGAIAAFKILNSEAENFKSTVAGANIELATAAYIGTYQQVLHDINVDIGKAVAETQSKWKQFWGTAGATVKQYFISGAWKDSMGDFNGPSVGNQLQQTFLDQINLANKAGKQASIYADDIYKLERRRKELAVDIAKLDAKIADNLAIAKDNSNSIAVRQAAIAKAEEALAIKKDLTVTLEKEITDLYQKNSDLAEDSVADADALLAQQARYYQVSRGITLEELALTKVKNTINAQAALSAAAAEKEAKAAKQKADAIAAIKTNLSGKIDNPLLVGQATEISIKLAAAPGSQEIFDYVFSTTIPGLNKKVMIGFEYDRSKLIDISKDVEAILTNLAETTGEVMGQLVGDLITGGDAWGNFRNSALSALGDMAISVGKMAVATGVATLGIKAALESLNGYVAIAAGTALIILGQAVKSGLSNVAAGNYSSGAPSVAAASTSATSSDFATKEVTVNVTGTLKADGNQLITVIQNTQNRNSYTG